MDDMRRLRGIMSSGIKHLLGKVGIGVTSHANLLALQEKSSSTAEQDLLFMKSITGLNVHTTLGLLDKSKSQLRQDLFVLSKTNYKREGFFVEFGATNGIHLSNTYLLETEFSWRGILAEPAKIWHKKLIENRPHAAIETACVWSESNTSLVFKETAVPHLSTIGDFSSNDEHKNSRLNGKEYYVKTISLNDLLKNNKAPRHIDYLSIDTEGSEFEILQNFDFGEYSFGVITVEHNFTATREKIYALLTYNGYKREYESISAFDDWYTKTE
jgi:FkbM family methyltransferase